jgi:hypothetical protein
MKLKEFVQQEHGPIYHEYVACTLFATLVDLLQGAFEEGDIRCDYIREAYEELRTTVERRRRKLLEMEMFDDN